jgi:hypothetical protein
MALQNGLGAGEEVWLRRADEQTRAFWFGVEFFALKARQCNLVSRFSGAALPVPSVPAFTFPCS